MLAQQIANGLATGLCYAILACGLSLTYSASGIVNFAHGDLFVLAAFIGIFLQHAAGLPFLLAAACAVSAVTLLSALIGAAVVQRIRGPLYQSVATIALSLGLRDLMLVAFGSDTASFTAVYPEGSIFTASVALPKASAYIATLLLVVAATFGYLMIKSRWGLWMRAAASNQGLAAAFGISVQRMRVLSFAIAGALAALAGVIVGPVWQVSSSLGGLVALKAFAAAVIGGFGNLRGALVGGVLLGLTESLFAGYVSSSWRDFAVYGLLILVMAIAPRGLVQTAVRRVA